MSLNGINAGYAATAATAIEKVQKADKATASSKESAYKSEAGAPTKQPSVLLLNGQKMPHWLPS